MSATDTTTTPASDTATADAALEPDFGRQEMDWLETHGDELQAQHANRLVAVQGSELVAVADDVVTLLERARAAGHPHPFVVGIPDAPLGFFV
jgi:hypothetical protein